MYLGLVPQPVGIRAYDWLSTRLTAAVFRGSCIVLGVECGQQCARQMPLYYLCGPWTLLLGPFFLSLGHIIFARTGQFVAELITKAHIVLCHS